MYIFIIYRMLFNSIIILFIIITILLIMQKNKLFIFGLLLTIFMVLTKNNYENYASMDIYYQNQNNQEINKDNMLNIFKNTKNNYYNIYKTVSDKTNINCENIFNNYIIDDSYSYILVKEIDDKYYTLNGFIYDINNSDVYIEEATEYNLSNHQNYGLKFIENKVDKSSSGFSIYLQPKNNKYTSNIPGLLLGLNNGSIKVDPMLGNTNSIFYITYCSNTILDNGNTINNESENIKNNLPSQLQSNLETVYECSLECNNQLYLNYSTFENTIKNNKKVILNSDSNSQWLLLIYKNTINELYENFRN